MLPFIRAAVARTVVIVNAIQALAWLLGCFDQATQLVATHLALVVVLLPCYLIFSGVVWDAEQLALKRQFQARVRKR